VPDSRAAPSPPLDYAGLRAAAEAFIPVLAARAAETEALRRLPDATVAELKDAGLTRLCQPRRVGGAELPLDQAVDIMTVLARGCASTAWVCGIYSDHAATIGTFDARAVDDIWATDPTALVSAGVTPGGKATPDGADGWRLSGRWGWSSGCDFADWVMLSTVLPAHDDAPGGIHMCLVPRSDFTIVDDWHVMGMCGTGSKTVVVENAWVPRYRMLAAAAAARGGASPAGREAGALYRLSRPSTVPFFLVAPALGCAEAALAAHIDDIGARQSRGARVAEFPTAQMHVAEAAAEIDAARLLMMRDLRAAMAAAEAGEEWTMADRARGRRDQAYVGLLCRRAVDRLFTAAGGSGLMLSGDQQRRFRDIHAITAHLSMSWDIAATTYGRIAFGLEPAGASI
jgi:alkylation response protein AidB-like acyl-CoA dehydrogenase